MYFTVHGEEHDKARLKGKSVTEFSRNLEREGWPAEVGEEERDRVKYAEKRNRYSLKPHNAVEIKKNMGVDLVKNISKKAGGLTRYKTGYPGVKKDIERVQKKRKIFSPF